MKNLIKGRIPLLLIFVLGAGILYYANVSVGYASKINALESELTAAKKQSSELEIKLSEKEKELLKEVSEIKSQLEAAELKLQSIPGIQAFEIEELKKKGLKDPIKDLIADLMNRKDLIPYKGVLGGTMGFYCPENIHILSAEWAAAYFDDGHSNGIILLRYNVSKTGKINWYVIDSKLY